MNGAIAPDLPDGARIEAGSPADYARLAHHHYRSGPPATIARVLRATMDAELAGVLVVSMPARNASWRDVAWAGAFTASDPRQQLRLLNAGVRCISRVVVEPRFRGLGLGASLVRAYLASALTPCTEAVATMGPFSGLFARAGMRAIALGLPPGDERLLEALRACGLRHDDLMTFDGRRRVLARPELVREVRAWVRSRSALRARAGEPAPDLALLAAMRILPRRVAYVSGPGPVRGAPEPPAQGSRALRTSPHVPLIFMLAPDERRACLRMLGRLKQDRRAALLRVLNIPHARS
ncbi:MAG: hypothetical protein IT439_02745 [Phycisphaerales bacterium]|nr:hypothetical protein [Phycisphaerales bacterium]